MPLWQRWVLAARCTSDHVCLMQSAGLGFGLVTKTIFASIDKLHELKVWCSGGNAFYGVAFWCWCWNHVNWLFFPLFFCWIESFLAFPVCQGRSKCFGWRSDFSDNMKEQISIDTLILWLSFGNVLKSTNKSWTHPLQWNTVSCPFTLHI